MQFDYFGKKELEKSKKFFKSDAAKIISGFLWIIGIVTLIWVSVFEWNVGPIDLVEYLINLF